MCCHIKASAAPSLLSDFVLAWRWNWWLLWLSWEARHGGRFIKEILQAFWASDFYWKHLNVRTQTDSLSQSLSGRNNKHERNKNVAGYSDGFINTAVIFITTCVMDHCSWWPIHRAAQLALCHHTTCCRLRMEVGSQRERETLSCLVLKPPRLQL